MVHRKAGEQQAAYLVVEAVALANGTQLMHPPPNLIDKQPSAAAADLTVRQEVAEWLQNTAGLLRHNRKLSKQAIILAVMWFWLSFGFYSYSMWLPSILRAKGASESDKYRDVLLAGVAQLPGTALAALLVNILGRRMLLAVALAA